jgi:hypothetical protein
MKAHFQVTIERFKELSVLPEGWTPEGYRTLLTRLEFDGVDSLADDELAAYAGMALQDLEPEEAAQALLAQLLDGRLTAGQRRNLSEEMKNQRQWEEYADMSCHEAIFNAQVLLHEAFPRTYPAPDIEKLTLRITALSPTGESLLRKPLSDLLLVRILADGMPETAVLKRLFGAAIVKGAFPEAAQIVWQHSVETPPGNGSSTEVRRLTIYSPRCWVGPLEEVDEFTSAALPDMP